MARRYGTVAEVARVAMMSWTIHMGRMWMQRILRLNIVNGHLKSRFVQCSNRRNSLIFCTFGIQHGEEHFPVTVAFGLISTQDFSEARRRWLVEDLHGGEHDLPVLGVDRGEVVVRRRFCVRVREVGD